MIEIDDNKDFNWKMRCDHLLGFNGDGDNISIEQEQQVLSIITICTTKSHQHYQLNSLKCSISVHDCIYTGYDSVSGIFIRSNYTVAYACDHAITCTYIVFIFNNEPLKFPARLGKIFHFYGTYNIIHVHACSASLLF